MLEKKSWKDTFGHTISKSDIKSSIADGLLAVIDTRAIESPSTYAASVSFKCLIHVISGRIDIMKGNSVTNVLEGEYVELNRGDYIFEATESNCEFIQTSIAKIS